MVDPKKLGNEWITQLEKLEAGYREVNALEKAQSSAEIIAEKTNQVQAIKSKLTEISREISQLGSDQEKQAALNCFYEGSGPYKGRTPLTALSSLDPGVLPGNDAQDYLEFLVGNGANLNQLDSAGYAPIHYAIHSAANSLKNKGVGAVEYFDQLMAQNGIDIHVQSREGITPIQQAMITNELGLITPLVKLGAGLELLESHKKIPGNEKSANAGGNEGENKFQDLFIYPNKGKTRAYVEEASTERARIVNRDGPGGRFTIDNLETQFHRDSILALADKKTDEDGNPYRTKVYRSLDEDIKAKEVEIAKRQAELSADGQVQKEEIDNQLKTLRDELANLSRLNQNVIFENMDKFYAIIANPAEFLQKNQEEQQTLLTSIFDPKHIPPFDKLNPLLEQRAAFLKKLREERSATKEIANTIMLGHRLGFVGKFDYEVDGKKRKAIAYEGFSVYHTMLSINTRVSDLNALVQKGEPIPHVTAQFTQAEKQALQIVADTYKNMDKTFDTDTYTAQANRYKNNQPILIPCHWPGHIANIVMYKDKIYVSNKGGGTLVPSVRCYQIDVSKLPRNANGELDGTKLASLIETLSTKNRKSDMSASLDLDELKALGPKLLYERRLQGQKQGNCTYTNTKRGADAIMMALKDDANQLQQKKDKGEELTPQENDILKYKDIDNQKVFKAFTTYDRFSSIDEYIEKHKDSSNIHKWDPLVRYLQTKANGNDPRSIEIAKHVLDKLKSPPINKKENEIVLDMKNLKHKPSRGDNFGYFLRHLEAGLLKGDRQHLSKAFYLTIPGGVAFQRNKGLIAAGMNPNELPRSNLQKMINFVSKPFRSKEKEARTSVQSVIQVNPSSLAPSTDSAAANVSTAKRNVEQRKSAVLFDSPTQAGEGHFERQRAQTELSSQKADQPKRKLTH
ncbi:hypothetical protein [Candidatus Berkiella aquae]|uniref:Uncharacterized protein n=1 Tax=Candidatus Berkiella aquae TaxID=295108 RepID=A0A0Q9Z0A9_9GAMM|nr:hypothetical protein [Candidatus Berkiella aquae]MCS5712164.1 hypothetical protein [Candidatus Berkiella aquae]